MMKNFALIGAAGYIAPRHLQAIKHTGNNLLAALDPSDSVGIMDGYFPDADFFTEFERFDRHIEKLRRKKTNQAIDYISICSPNYLHDSHARFTLRSGAHAICEKPLVLNPWNIDSLMELEDATGYNINTILQLRVHPAIIKLRNEVLSNPQQMKKHEVDLTYITSRGHWYFQSWKGDVKKSGGIATNIGVHFFDMLHFIFGKLQINKVYYATESKCAGYLEYEKARVRWFLSVDINDIPVDQRSSGKRTYRSINIDGAEVEFSEGFTDLHLRSYEEILKGNGFRLEENRVAIETVSAIRNAPISNNEIGELHPIVAAMQ
jgi:UDP-N-acetyl-2-amino-2-deoxyglucuronate dehydrogenase